MEEVTGSIQLNYYEPHLGEENIQILKDELSQIGAVRTRQFIKELGGESPDIVVAIQWVGLAVAGGIIQHLTAKYYEKVLAAFNRYIKESSIERPDFQPYVALVFSYDDLDIEVTLPDTTNISFFDKVMKKIGERVSMEPLVSKEIIKISIPYYFDETEKAWMQTFDWAQANFESRYWAIGTVTYLPGYTVIDDIYDSKENRFLKAPVERIV